MSLILPPELAYLDSPVLGQPQTSIPELHPGSQPESYESYTSSLEAGSDQLHSVTTAEDHRPSDEEGHDGLPSATDAESSVSGNQKSKKAKNRDADISYNPEFYAYFCGWPEPHAKWACTRVFEGPAGLKIHERINMRSTAALCEHQSQTRSVLQDSCPETISRNIMPVSMLIVPRGVP